MTTKLIGLAAIALTTALVSMGASAHSGGDLVSSSGKAVVDGKGECVKAADGSYDELCHPKPEAEPEPVAQKITLSGDALFDTNSDVVNDSGKATLNELAVRANLLKDEKISIVGHADSRGAEAYNQDLSERRAAAVKNYFVSRGVDANSMSTSGRGESDPVASNDTAAGRQKNRRVEISISGLK